MRYIFVLLCALALGNAQAQTLFTYGKDKVSADEFLRAYNKSASSSDPVSVGEYLELYIASRLKVKEARQRGYDTLPQIISELANLRAQLTPSYMNDEEGTQALVDEAFARSQKDIRLSHIFISLAPDSNAAKKKLEDALKVLNNGADFSSVAKMYSEDPSVQSNGGDIGYITVFSLPYELENLAYQTAPGKISVPHRSRSGYHIFKNNGERKALGKMRAAQILIAYPPGASDAARADARRRADSIYQLLVKGGDFSKLAEEFSNDVVSAASGGMIPEFGVGEFEQTFENQVFGLKEDNALSSPFETAHGWHIVKRMSLRPVPASMDDEYRLQVREKVELTDRVLTLRVRLMNKVVKLVPHKTSNFKPSDLWAFSDSSFNNLAPKGSRSLQTSTTLFTTVKEKTSVADWISWAQVNRFKRDGSGFKPYPELWQEFLEHQALQYYSNHLEDYDPAFRQQLEEFKEGNLFFEIMQREVWEKAQMDTIALKNYYAKHKDRYRWKKSADAVIFFANDPETANEARDALKTRTWKEVQRDFSNRIIADSARYETDQLPNGSSEPIRAGQLTTVATNADNSASFAYVIKVYEQPETRSFEEAKGMVINDYQAELDKEWIAKLKKKYPVVIDKKVWAEVQTAVTR